MIGGCPAKGGSDAGPALRISPTRVRSIRRKLLRWYDRSARDLPWRRRPGDVYAQWIAEVMLQQTRVETVLAYYARFLRRFPGVEALAAAPLDEVLKVWQGLGYYRRAENLHRAARIVAGRGGVWPETLEEWLELPGIGRYTAGAIVSIAFGRRAVAVDGNVARVLSRLTPVQSVVTRPPGRRIIEAVATRLLPVRRCGGFNQAWMDLGSAVCTPRAPQCEVCPLAEECEGRRRGLTDRLPVRQTRAAPRTEERVVAAVVDDDRLLMVQRGRGGRWPGLWELPNADCNHKPHPRVLSDLLADLSLPAAASCRCLGEVQHRLTHRVYRFHVYLTLLPGGRGRRRSARGRRWVPATGANGLAIATAHHRMLGRIRDELQAGR
ncbi:MAG TPA: A/G-specific adenine glycosylase [Phycisphaerae bacterium]|nr:A/G-specific adenine glycosylase [Phycisphaerae bacterium]